MAGFHLRHAENWGIKILLDTVVMVMRSFWLKIMKDLWWYFLVNFWDNGSGLGSQYINSPLVFGVCLNPYKVRFWESGKICNLSLCHCVFLSP